MLQAPASTANPAMTAEETRPLDPFLFRPRRPFPVRPLALPFFFFCFLFSKLVFSRLCTNDVLDIVRPATPSFASVEKQAHTPSRIPCVTAGYIAMPLGPAPTHIRSLWQTSSISLFSIRHRRHIGSGSMAPSQDFASRILFWG